MSDPVTTRYIRNETLVNIVINVIFSLLFYLLVFHTAPTVRVWRGPGLAVDMLPQTFMIGLMSALAPGLLTGKRIRAGRAVLRLDGRSRLPSVLLVRSLIIALGCAILFGGASIALLAISGAQTLALVAALPLKMAIGGLESLIVTPFALRATILHATAPHARTVWPGLE